MAVTIHREKSEQSLLFKARRLTASQAIFATTERLIKHYVYGKR